MSPNWRPLLLCLLPVLPLGILQAAPEHPLHSCSQALGKKDAAALVASCRNLSPATHPPCNAANSCALIRDEIARSCAFLGDKEAAKQSACGPLPSSAAAAAAVVERYYAAIAAGDYGTAWQQWGNDGQPGTTYARFSQGFAHTRTVAVTLGALPPIQGAMGGLYAEVPVTVRARLDDGTRQTFVGTYRVRRVNDIDGASADQRRWHLDGAQLRLQR